MWPRVGRGLIRFLAVTVSALVAALVLMVVAFAVLTQTETGRLELAQTLSQLASTPGDSEVRIEGIGPGLPRRLSVEHVVLADAAGPWLEIRDLRFRWRPWALLVGRLHVEEIGAGDVNVLRTPAPAAEPVEPPPEEERASFHIPRLPVAVRINRLTVGALRLSSEVAGEPIALAIDGRLAAKEGRIITSELHAQPLEGDAGGLVANAAATFDTDAQSLVVDALVREPAGGPLSAILGLADRPALSVMLAGRGPIADWHGTFAADVERLTTVQADLSLHAGETNRAAITGHATIAEGLVPALAPALAQGVRFEAQLSQPDSDTVTLEHLALDATGARIAGSGAVDLDRSTVTGTLEAEVARDALAADALGPVDFTDARVTVTASGPMSVPEVQAEGRIDQMRAPGMTASALTWTAALASVADVSADAETVPGWAVQAAVRTDGLALEAAPASGLVGDQPTLSLRAETDAGGEHVTLHSLQIDGQAISLVTNGAAATRDGPATADLRVIVSDLARTGMPGMAGRAELTSHVEGNPSEQTATGTLQVATQGLASGIPAVDALLGQQPTLDSTFSWSALDGITVPQVRLNGQAMQGEARAHVAADGQALDSTLDLRIPSLQPLSVALGTPMRGTARLQVTASGDAADPEAVAELRLDDAGIGETGIPHARLDVRARQVVSAAQGRLEADAQTDSGPLSAATNFALTDGDHLRLDGLRVDGLGVEARGEIQAALAQQRFEGALHAGPRTPSAGVRFGSTAVTGPFNLDLRLRPDAAGQQVQARFRGGPLTLREGEAETLAVGALRADVDVADALRAPRFAAQIALTDAGAGGARLATADATAEGTLQGSNGRAQIAINATAADAEMLQLQARSDVAIADGAVAIELQQLDGTLAREPLALMQRARLLLAGSRMELDGLKLTLGPARLSADGRLQPGETALTFNAEDVPVALGRAISPQAPTDGTLESRVTLWTVGRETAGEADVRVQGLTWQENAAGTGNSSGSTANNRPVEDYTKVDLTVAARLGGGRLTLDGNAAGKGATATVVGRVPVRLPAGTVDPVVNQDGPMEGRLTLASDLRLLAHVLAFHDQRLEGHLDGDVWLGGSLRTPSVDGGVNVRDGLYENFVVGTLLQNIAIAIEADGPRALRLQMTGTDGNSGRIAADGRASLNEAGEPVIDADISADRATLVRRDDATVTTNARLAYAQQGSTGRLTGDVETTDVQVRLLDRLPPQVVQLPVREIGGPQEDDGNAEAAGEPWSATLDLTIRLPNRVFVRGRGLESEWAGALSVSGTTAEPRIGGEIHLVRGNFVFAGKRFELQRGSARFDGDKRPDPYIDAQAEYRASELTAWITVTGLSSDPKLSMTSQPPLPESEILSQVLFGKSSAKLGPVEAVQLAAAMDTLARGESMSDDILDFARTMLGLDTLTVQPGSGGDEGSSIAVGRYVGDRVYIGAQQGLEDDSHSGTVEVEILPGISIESEIGQDQANGAQGSLGLKWKLDY